MEGITNFKYLVRPLDQMDYDWLALRWNFNRSQRVWGRLGKAIIREEADSKVEDMVYRVVT